jgi:hypothetical protein
MFVQAKSVEFRPKQCPNCRHYSPEPRRCRAPSNARLGGLGPDDYLYAYFKGEAEYPCSSHSALK